MSPQEFRKLWNEPLTQASAESLAKLPFLTETKTFLIEGGLPESAAPFLSFYLQDGDGLINTAEQWRLNSNFADFWSIGSNGSGDPICIKKNEEIVYLNHDNHFQETFINSSVRHLAGCLLVYRQMIEELNDGYLSDNIPEEWKQRTWKLLCDVDGALSQRKNMWSQEIANLG